MTVEEEEGARRRNKEEEPVKKEQGRGAYSVGGARHRIRQFFLFYMVRLDHSKLGDPHTSTYCPFLTSQGEMAFPPENISFIVFLTSGIP